MRGRRTGQSTLEAAIFFAVVTAALIAMTPYVRRSIQANLKGLEDRINPEATKTPLPIVTVPGVPPGGDPGERVPVPCRKNPDHPSCDGV